MDISFNSIKPSFSQRTIAKIISQHKYYFVSVNEYTNNLFYCIIRYEDVNSFFMSLYNAVKIKLLEPKPTYIEKRLSIAGDKVFNDEYIVFDRKEIENMIKDSPENYIGDKVL